MARIYQEGRLLSTIAGILFLHCLTSAEGKRTATSLHHTAEEKPGLGLVRLLNRHMQAPR